MNKRQVTRAIGVLLLVLLLITPPKTTAQTGPTSETRLRRVTTNASRQLAPVQIVLTPEADAFISSNYPNQNFGSGMLRLGYHLLGDDLGAQRLFLRFPIQDAVPTGVRIDSARLQLYANSSSPADDHPMPTTLQRIDADWSENTITWNDEPTWGPETATSSIGSTAGWYEWLVTQLVRDWIAGTPNHGLEILGDEVIQQRERIFYSRDTATAFQPRLIIDYTELDDEAPPIVTVDTLPEYTGPQFTVRWTGTDPGESGIAHYDVQVRVNDGDWSDWQMNVTFTEAGFAGEHGHTYAFRARGVDVVGNVEAWGDAEASTTVDALPPDSTIDPLPAITGDTTFVVAWSGTDADAGIDHFDINYRFGAGVWMRWLTGTSDTSAIFDVTALGAPNVDDLYQFEVRATDNVGNQELFTGTPEASIIVDTVAPFVTPRLWLPLIYHQAPPAP